MSCSSNVSRTFEFFCAFGAAEKNKEKVEANCNGFSAEFFGSQSVEIKKSNVNNFFPEFFKNPPTSS